MNADKEPPADPSVVPQAGNFFLHDDRGADDGPPPRSDRRPGEGKEPRGEGWTSGPPSDKEWKHDLFDQDDDDRDRGFRGRGRGGRGREDRGPRQDWHTRDRGERDRGDWDGMGRGGRGRGPRGPGPGPGPGPGRGGGYRDDRFGRDRDPRDSWKRDGGPGWGRNDTQPQRSQCDPKDTYNDTSDGSTTTTNKRGTLSIYGDVPPSRKLGQAARPGTAAPGVQCGRRPPSSILNIQLSTPPSETSTSASATPTPPNHIHSPYSFDRTPPQPQPTGGRDYPQNYAPMQNQNQNQNHYQGGYPARYEENPNLNPRAKAFRPGGP